MPDIPIYEDRAGAILPVLVVPGASRSEMVGPHGAHIRIRVAAAAEKGRANRAAGQILSDFFAVRVTLVGGQSSRRKRFLLEGLDRKSVYERITEEWG